MVHRFTGRYCKLIALLFMSLMYGELAASLYIGSNWYKQQQLITHRSIAEYAAAYFRTENKSASSAEAFIPSNALNPGSIKLMDPQLMKLNAEDNVTSPEDIGGPGQPEMAGFKSASVDNMVNLFTGDFSYNIPLLDLGGYPVNLFYNAGVGMDQDASWVGLGWNLNPGTISRNMRGLPDDYDGDPVIKVQNMRRDRTIGVSGSTGREVVGVTGMDVRAGIYYNNRRGLGLELGGSFDYSPQRMLSWQACDDKTLIDSLKTLSSITGGISGSVDLNSQNGLSAGIGFSIYMANKDRDAKFGLSTSIGYQSRQGLTDLTIQAERYKYSVVQNGDEFYVRGSNRNYHIGTMSFARTSYMPTIRMPLTRSNQLYSLKLGKENRVLFSSGTVAGYVQDTRIDPMDTAQSKPAYGYMHARNAEENEDALMDFNRLNDGVYTLKTPMISVPVYTYDVFTINGEGTGGSFRGYHGNPGFVKDNATRSRSGSFQLTLDLGVKNIFHGGSSIGGVTSTSDAEEWRTGNGLRNKLKLKESSGVTEGFYFKNPAEKAIIDESYYEKYGEDQLIRPYLMNTRAASPTLGGGYRVIDDERKAGDILSLVDGANRPRDKRSQVISYLTAEEASVIGLDKLIYSYVENRFKPGVCNDDNYRSGYTRFSSDADGYRKSHHISQINVLEASGQRYVYGIPVYQIKQKEVTFSVEGTPSNQQITYNSTGDNPDNSVRNDKGRDGYYQREELKGYAHSFLLTGILSPDYVDITGDGITDDDLGTAVKFNYSRIDRQLFYDPLLGKSRPYWFPFRWRMPVEANKASYNEGLKSDDRDDKGMYTYGEKELWYVHSIESKNMVATFHISGRNDGKQVLNENGGVSASPLRLQKLDSIRVFTKADLIKNPTTARPIKTVYFKYSYRLCQSYPLNGGAGENGGKLTLDSIWFSYNGHTKIRKNKYVFRYGAVSAGDIVNPSYNSTYSDRWGNYKPSSVNPDAVSNNDYPYSVQDADNANRFAYAWNLTDILLPSGGTISVKYEADDYAFIQDKRASQMYTIAGFAKTADGTPTNKLYTFNKLSIEDNASPPKADHRFVFFDVTTSIPDKEAIATRYLQDFKQLLMKLSVEMPAGNIGEEKAFETIIVYGAIKNYDLAPDASPGSPDGLNHMRFYVELEPTRRDGSPIMQTVMQFLKDQLPQRAYPGFQVNGDGALKQVVRAVWGMVDGLRKAVRGFEKDLKWDGKCRMVDISQCFARLNNSEYKKKGGGHRVKSIIIGDNWSKLLKRTEEASKLDSYYGQEYDYTTLEEVNGVPTVISSGVATYEPGVGNEENPFREILQYTTRQPLGPTEVGNVELPFAETFYPAPMIGYSRVTVRSIHNKSNKRVKAGVGLQQTNFFTTRDFPVMADFTSFDQESRHHHKPPLLNKVFNFNKKEYVTLTQGYRVVLNDMNGKVKSQASFPENDYKTPINFTAYYYRLINKGDGKYKLDNKVPVISGPDGKVSYKLIGKEIEVMNDFREHFTTTRSGQLPLNVEVFRAGMLPIIIPTLFRMAFRDESRYRSATTLKVVNEYGILDSVVNIDKGSVVGTKNMVYDAETGDVLLSRTSNEFKDPVYQFSYPAWWVESGMAPAYRNIDMIYKGVLFRNGMIEGGSTEMLDNFESGDEIFILDADDKGPLENFACVVAGYPLQIPVSTERLIWAVDMRKDGRNTTRKFIFLDREGKPFNAVNATIRVVRSGRRNIVSAAVGGFTSLANPLKTVDSVERIVIDETTNVLNAAAMEFKEKWRANDQFYSQDTTVVTVRQTQIEYTTLLRDSVYSGYLKVRHSKGTESYNGYSNIAFEIAKKRDKESGKRYDYDLNSWARFTLPSQLEGATIYNATLRMDSHNPLHNRDFSAFQPLHIGNHAENFPHQNVNHFDHYAPMTIKLSRMTTPWQPTSANSSWRQIFFDNARTDLINNYVIYTPPFVPYQQAFKGSYRVNVKDMIQSMVNNYGNAGVTPGIKISFLQNSGAMDEHNEFAAYRYCFTNEYGQGDGYKLPAEPVRVYVEYYKCNSSDPVVYEGGLSGEPTTPPYGYVYCREEVTGKMCFSTFSKKQMNPYIQGVLGNWRAYRSYVFYGDRRQTSVSTATNIRTDGVLANFVHYWAFDESNLQLGKSGNAKWVWNSEVTQYNRRGAELENHDPLGRYNAGIYGYQETLPVAVINNSRLRLSAFDGFEDYFYQDEPCEPFCKPSKRHFNTGIPTEQLDDSVSHSGRYSLKINSNTTQNIDIKVSADDRVIDPDLRIKLESSTGTDFTTVTPNGIGLKGTYYNRIDFTGTSIVRMDPYVNLSFLGNNDPGKTNCKNSGNLPSGVNCNQMSVIWTGKIQVTRTGWYQFDVDNIDDEILMHVTNASNVSVQVISANYNSPKVVAPVYLEAGDLNEVEVKYTQYSYTGRINLLWRQPGVDGEIDPTQPFTTIRPAHFYPEGEEGRATGTVNTTTIYCVKPDTIQAINHHLIDSFNLVPGTKMVASMWVKKGNTDCACSSYDDLLLRIKNTGGGVEGTFAPKEKIIEGWQLFETVFTVPEGHNKLVLELNAPSDKILYVDDLRFHPFNANMKSFVYDPVTLRLVAELDENNFAAFYEYDDEGTLIRSKKETRLGVKTITETRSAIQKEVKEL
ncbi:MAG: hypothetical protein GXC78_03165 [Chitinophagaceae bacterium]|nr:hypothetical protein [Chitinophagaceae bacterium]